MSKVCNVCKENLPLDAFNKNKSRRDGLEYHCRECGKAKGKKYFEKNREIVNAKHLDYQRKNPELVRAQKNNYYKTHKELVLKKQHEYRKENKELIALRLKMQIENLGDRYIKHMLKKQLGLIDVPQELIEAKRNLLIVQRELRSEL